MVSNRHKTSRPAPIWRSSQAPRETQSIRAPPTWSHINTQPALENEERANGTLTEKSFRRDSIQEEIDASLFHSARTFGTTAPSGLPRTFAEAAMSTRRGVHDPIEGDSRPSITKPTGLESQSSSKYTFKKKKKAAKWTPFDLGAADSASEGGSLHESSSLSRGASPAPVTSVWTSQVPVTTTTTPPPVATSTADSSRTPTATFANLGETYQAPLAPDCVNAQGVPAEDAPLTSIADPSPAPDETDNAPVQSSDPLLTGTNNSHSGGSEAQSRIDGAMANSMVPIDTGKAKENGNDSYGSLESNPELQPAAAPTSTEPSPTPAQPVTYTTVGSIVDPNAVPQFTAPNRIQREGSGRRPVQLIQNRQYDPYYNMYRAHSPHMTAGLHHAHVPVQSPNRFDPSHSSNFNPSRSTGPTHPFQHDYSLTEQEKSVLSGIHGSNMANMFDTSSQNTSVAVPPPNYPMGLTNITQSSYNAGDMTGDEARRHHISTQGLATGPVQGLEKMQTLQRLSKFDNPMQNLALSRLSAFSVSKPNGASITPADARLGENGLPRREENKLATLLTAGAGAQQPGELNRSYRFPLATAVDPPQPQANPLFGAFSPSTMRPSNDPPRGPPGYPAPLTAGPPGQRQYQGTMNRARPAYPDSNWRSGPQISAFNPYAGTPTQSSSAPSEVQDTPYMVTYTFQSIVPSNDSRKCKSFLVDTLDSTAISKYYPGGMPPEMNGNIRPLPSKIRREMDVASGDLSAENAAEISARKTKELEDWFYDGQRRYIGMTGADHIKEHEERLLETVNPFKPLGRRPREPHPPVQANPISAEEMEKMTVAEVAGPLLHAGFGSLLTYMTPTDAPDTSRVLSRFAPSPAWQLDDSADGNKSFYMQNVPPKEIREDPKDN